jgi:hypothetical protein
MFDQVRGRRFTISPAAAANPVRQRSEYALRVDALILLREFPQRGRYLQTYLQALAMHASKKEAPANAGASEKVVKCSVY